MKLLANLKEVVLAEDELFVGCLVRSTLDENATGMIVKILPGDEVLVLWSVPPKSSHVKTGEIW